MNDEPLASPSQEQPEASAPFEPELLRFVTFRLSRLQAALTAQAAKLLDSGPGLTLTQWRVLSLFDRSGQTTHGALLRTSAFDKGMLSRALRTMIDKGLITEARDDDDHRRQILRITPLGMRRREQAAPLMKRRRDRLMRDFTPEETAAFMIALDKLMEAALDKDLNP